jgi:hypothetical protein
MKVTNWLYRGSYHKTNYDHIKFLCLCLCYCQSISASLDKYTSLLHYRINYACKLFYGSGPWSIHNDYNFENILNNFSSKIFRWTDHRPLAKGDNWVGMKQVKNRSFDSIKELCRYSHALYS